jgi:hypothetical protein
VITGDNGLGKSFLLDVAWWALTRTWAGHPALPTNGGSSSIEYRVKGKLKNAQAVKSIFHRGLDGQIFLTGDNWAKQGDVTSWLVSNIFGLEPSRGTGSNVS